MATLPLFWDLSSPSEKERINASAKLVNTLERFQDHWGGEDDLDESNSPDVSYAIKRLVRGLASPRESSRLGFAVALTEVNIALYFCLSGFYTHRGFLSYCLV
jgi:DNA polymerase phi